MLTVKIGVMPGQINEYVISAGGTVKDALAVAGISATGYTIRYAGEDATLDTVVNADGVILLAKQIKGNK